MGIFKTISFFWMLTFISSCATIPLSSPPLNIQNLKTSQGHQINLEERIQQNQATILMWWGTQCPCVKRYQRRMETLQEQYASKGVRVFAVASNAQDKVDAINKVAQARNFQLPIVIDEHARLAKYYGVTTTPTAVLLDSAGSIQYLGWIDNEREIGVGGRKAYLESALIELLANKKISTPRGPIFGCAITKSFKSGG